MSFRAPRESRAVVRISPLCAFLFFVVLLATGASMLNGCRTVGKDDSPRPLDAGRPTRVYGTIWHDRDGATGRGRAHYFRCVIEYDEGQLAGADVDRFIRAWYANPAIVDPYQGCRFEPWRDSLVNEAGAYRFIYSVERARAFPRRQARSMLLDLAQILATILGKDVEMCLRNPMWAPGMPPSQQVEMVMRGRPGEKAPPKVSPPLTGVKSEMANDGTAVLRFKRCSLRYSRAVAPAVAMEFASIWWGDMAPICGWMPQRGWLVADGRALTFVFPRSEAREIRDSFVESFSEFGLYLARRFERDFSFAFPRANWVAGSVPSVADARISRVAYVAPVED